MHYIHLTEIRSTNTYVMRSLEAGATLPDQTIVYTMRQTAGRGQMGNTWDSEPDQNIAFSLLLHPSQWSELQPALGVSRQFVVSEMAALAVADTLSAYVPDCIVKWPNDIYHDDRKLAGILIENRIVGGQWRDCVVGIGININQMQFAADVPNAVSLRQLSVERRLAQLSSTTDVLLPADADVATRGVGREVLETAEAGVPRVEPEEVLRAVGRRLADAVADLRRRGDDAVADVHHRYVSSLYRREGLHPYIDVATGTRFCARIDDVAADGRLTLVDDEGLRRTYWFKEVRFVLPGGLQRE